MLSLLTGSVSSVVLLSLVLSPRVLYPSLSIVLAAFTLVIQSTIFVLLGVIMLTPLQSFLKDQGIPNEPEFHQPDKTTVFSFPQAAPKKGVVTSDLTAIEQLQTWLIYQRNWCEHKPSITVNVRDDEWLEVGNFVYQHFDEISGISFLPYSSHTYQQAPYQEVSWKEYVEMKRMSPKDIDWAKLKDYESEDNTTGSQSMACSSDTGCEIVDF
jgi:ribonucleoside-triphosphate reductase